MSENARKDYRRFRQGVRRYSKSLIHDFPDDAKEDWIVNCWRSFNAFVTRFPQSEDREAVLQRILEMEKIVKEAFGQRTS